MFRPARTVIEKTPRLIDHISIAVPLERINVTVI
jgi:hypothetical protein